MPFLDLSHHQSRVGKRPGDDQQHYHVAVDGSKTAVDACGDLTNLQPNDSHCVVEILHRWNHHNRWSLPEEKYQQTDLDERTGLEEHQIGD